MKKETNFEVSTRKSIFSELSSYDVCAKEHSFIEVTAWTNGEGYDICISNYSDAHISVGYMEFKLLKKLIKELEL
jgi:hypothetical protein